MWKKKECQQQRIDLNTEVSLPDISGLSDKHSGQAGSVLSMFALLMVLVFMLSGLKISHFMIAGAYVEDALAASNLASALIDVERYGKTRVIHIADIQTAFEVYKDALAINLQLDEEGNFYQQELFRGPVRILAYVIYNVENQNVEIHSFSENGHWEYTQGKVGEVFTPDGVQIDTTAIYSRVMFGVRGIGLQPITAIKEKSVDIKQCED